MTDLTDKLERLETSLSHTSLLSSWQRRRQSASHTCGLRCNVASWLPTCVKQSRRKMRRDGRTDADFFALPRADSVRRQRSKIGLEHLLCAELDYFLTQK